MLAPRTLFLAASLVPLLGVALVHAGNNELSIGSQTRALRTDSANAVTDDSLAGGTLRYARALDIELIPGLALWGISSFDWADARGTMFSTMSTELDTLSFSAGGRARYALHRLVVASAALDIGMTRMALGIDNSVASANASGWGPTSHVGVSLDLFAVRKASTAVGLRVELGYAAAAPVSLVARPESSSDDTLQLEMSTSSLGSLNLSGATFAMSLICEL
jgi:hypothetical protein